MPVRRLLLFDVDGTLIAAGGAGRRSIERAFAHHFAGRLGPRDAWLSGLRLDGMTDRLIVREGIERLGLAFDDGTCTDLLDTYLGFLASEIHGPGYRVLPGVEEALSGLASEGALLGLCTGNVREGARLKLARGGLDRFFGFGEADLNGFAQDGEARERIVEAALRRASLQLGRRVEPDEALVIGDTPRDVAAARAVGVPVLAVATGRFSVEELRACGADWALPSLAGPEALELLRAPPARRAPERTEPEPLSFGGPRLRAAPAAAHHAGAIQECLEAAPGYFVIAEGRPAAPGAAARLLAEAEADDRRRVYALVQGEGGPVVGVLDLLFHYPEPGVAHVALLLLRESLQGRGLGREAVTALEEALRAAAFAAVRLSVTDENDAARAFWERVGYAPVGRLAGGVTVFEKVL